MTNTECAPLVVVGLPWEVTGTLIAVVVGAAVAIGQTVIAARQRTAERRAEAIQALVRALYEPIVSTESTVTTSEASVLSLEGNLEVVRAVGLLPRRDRAVAVWVARRRVEIGTALANADDLDNELEQVKAYSNTVLDDLTSWQEGKISSRAFESRLST